MMLEETKDTITVPAAFMIRMLACIHSLRTRRGNSNTSGNSSVNANASENSGDSSGSSDRTSNSSRSGTSRDRSVSSGASTSTRGTPSSVITSNESSNESDQIDSTENDSD